MRFEWDPEKARTNLIKHGLPFDLAEAAFGDPFQFVWHDDGDHDEDRWQCIAILPRGPFSRSSSRKERPTMAKPSSGSSRYFMQPEMSSDDIKRLLDEYADALEQNASGALRDGDIDRSDHPEWTEAMFRDATRGTFYRPRAGEAMVPLDTEVIVWFRQRYPDEYQTAMNAALRAYMASHDEERDDLDHRKTA